MKNIRLAQMEKIILGRKMVTLKELQDEFNISMNTVRRDVSELLKNENIKKVYGGVQYVMPETKISDFIERSSKEKEYKEIIGKRASRFVEDNDIIFIDSGTTTTNIIYYLCDKKNITVITNNLNVLMEACYMENIHLIGLGGEVNQRTFSFASKDSIRLLKDINIRKAFMAATGLTVKNGATNSNYEEKEIKSEVIRRSEEVFLLIDHTKFDNHTLFTYCDFKDIDHIITDKAPSKYKKQAKLSNINLVECIK